MNTIKAKRATITIAGIEIEVFQLPNGEYVMSQAQVAEAIGLQGLYVLRFLESEQVQGLLGKDFKYYNATIVRNNVGRGGRGQIKVIPINIAAAFWTVQAHKGNTKAQALNFACTVEALQRRCDKAFEIKRLEEQYEQGTIHSSEQWMMTRQFLRDAHNAFQWACQASHFNVAQAHDALTIAITGLKASEHRMLELIGDNENIGLDHIESTPVLRRIAYAKFMFAKLRKGTLEERIKKAVAKTYKSGY